MDILSRVVVKFAYKRIDQLDWFAFPIFRLSFIAETYSKYISIFEVILLFDNTG